MKNYEILLEKLDFFCNLRLEINRILDDCKRNIQIKISLIRNGNRDEIYELFKVQDEIAVVYHKYNYPIDDYLYNFMYEFDRQDEESVDYLFKKLNEDRSFLKD